MLDIARHAPWPRFGGWEWAASPPIATRPLCQDFSRTMEKESQRASVSGVTRRNQDSNRGNDEIQVSWSSGTRRAMVSSLRAQTAK